MSETLQVLSRDYDERSKIWYRGLKVVAGVCVFLMVAAIMIGLIFQVFKIYIGALQEATQM